VIFAGNITKFWFLFSALKSIGFYSTKLTAFLSSAVMHENCSLSSALECNSAKTMSCVRLENLAHRFKYGLEIIYGARIRGSS
jgi:hypothetical protein